MDLVVDLNFRMDTSALYSDIVLPAATWYEKDDINTTDMHSFINPMQEAVPPAWESRSDWSIFKALAKKVSELVRRTPPGCGRGRHHAAAGATTRADEIAQTEVADWRAGEAEAVPGVRPSARSMRPSRTLHGGQLFSCPRWRRTTSRFSLSVPFHRNVPSTVSTTLGIPGFQMMQVNDPLDGDELPTREDCDLSKLTPQMTALFSALANAEGLSLRQPFKKIQPVYMAHVSL